jgi:hypothetical protein
MEGNENGHGMEYDFMTHTAPLWQCGGVRAQRAARSLVTLVRNILEKPHILKYRSVPCSGAAFTARVASCEGALTVMANIGFVRQRLPSGDHFVMIRVDAVQLLAALRELELGLQTWRKYAEGREPQGGDDLVDEAAEALLHAGDGELDSMFEATVEPAQAAGAGVVIGSCSSGSCSSGSGSGRSGGSNGSSADNGADAGYYRRQLAARAAVHKVNAISVLQQERQRRRKSWCLAMILASALVVGVAFRFPFGLAAEDRRGGEKSTS